MDADELAEWEAYYSIEPFGDEWRQSARIVTMLCTAWGAKSLNEEMLMPNFGRRPIRQSRESMLAELAKAVR